MRIINSKRLSIILISLFALNLSAQNQKVKISSSVLQSNSSKGLSQRSAILHQPLSKDVDTSNTAKWNKSLICFEKSHKTAPAFQKIIDRKTAEKIANSNSIGVKTDSLQALSPNIETNFGTMSYTGFTPPDNTLAISKDGIIVTAINSKLEYYDTIGTLLYSANFDDFINDSNIFSVFYDPIIQYDSDSDRFVMVVLNGTQSSTSNVTVCFSKTNNPLDGWWVYYLTGNPMNDSTWFDFPKLGISNDEIFITGNIFTNTFKYKRSVIYQIDKQKGYQGYTLDWAFWYDISGNPFTIVPASYGQEGNYGPGLYFISSYSYDDTATLIPYLRVYDLTGNLNDTSVALTFYSQILPFALVGNAQQSGTTILLDNGLPIVQDAFYLNGIIHFVYASEYANGFSGLNYNRLNVATMTNWHSIYGVPNFDCSYPSLASFGSSPTDKTVMLCFLKSGALIYPETRVISCDDLGQWSASRLLKGGEVYVSYASSNGLCRWGDYTDIALRHNSLQPVVWANGCFGKLHITPFGTSKFLSSWVGKINGLSVGMPKIMEPQPIISKVYPNPSSDFFTLEFTNENTQWIKIYLTDINGKEVKLFYNDVSRKGKNQYLFNRDALEKGIYFLIIENATERIAIEKLIVQ